MASGPITSWKIDGETVYVYTCVCVCVYIYAYIYIITLNLLKLKTHQKYANKKNKMPHFC